MTRTTVAVLAGIGLAAVVASRLDADLATGVLAGYLFGAALGLLGLAWQRHTLRTRPERTFLAIAQSFLFEIAGLLGGVLAVRFVEPAARVADWKSFALAYATAVFLCIVLGSFESLRHLGSRSAIVAPSTKGGSAL
jgi:hypothetical protein